MDDCEGDYTDEVTRALLRDDVAKARADEMEWCEMFKACQEVTDERCVSRTGRKNPSPVDGKTSKKMTAKAWKYEVDFLRVRSIRKGLAATSPRTPPFALVRYVISKAETISTCVKPPHLRDTGRCWLLKKCMYGTLPAAAGWQHLVQKVVEDIGLLCSSNCPCGFGHSSRELDMVVHGDDFIVVGCGADLDWLSQTHNEKFELVQKARLGPGRDSEATVLNRCVTTLD